MATSRECEIPELFPQPKSIRFGEGISRLAFAVRLDSNNVLPLQRKAVRTILAGAGVKVIANKKTFVVKARVEDAAEFDLGDVPPDCRKDYYELQVQDSEVILRSPCQEGMIWAAQTACALFRLVKQGSRLPNLSIRDWPDMPVRGLSLGCTWGAEHMALSDWCQVIDVASSLKLNVLGIGIYDCDSRDRFDADGAPYECLMVPLGQRDDEQRFVDELDAVTRHRLRWFNVKADMWRDEAAPPLMQQQNFLKDVVLYGIERGVQVMPSFQFSGRSLLFPRLHPEFSARDGDGRPTGAGYCYQAPGLREYFATVLGRFVKRYFPNGPEFFQIRLDDDGFEHVSAEDWSRRVPSRCRCPACAAPDGKPPWLDFAAWLVRFLKEQGVRKVVFGGGELDSPEARDALAARLGEEGLQDDAVLLVTSAPDGAPAAPGVETWLSPAAGNGIRLAYENAGENLQATLLEAARRRAPGVVLPATGDAAYMDQLALLGCVGWEDRGRAPEAAAIRSRWAELQFGTGAAPYQECVERFSALIRNPLFAASVPYVYSCAEPEEDGRRGRDFPAEALRRIAACDPAEGFPELTGHADRILQLTEGLLADEDLPYPLKDCLESFRQDAALLKAWLETLALLAGIHAAGTDARIDASLAARCRDARQALVDAMREFQAGKASWMIPRAMQPASEMMVFLEQLAGDIETAAAGGGAPLRWSLDGNWADGIEK